MPSKKRFNSRFPPARIKKIMQTDEDIGKVAAPVPVLISRALELFLQQILGKTSEVVLARNAKTLSKSHIKHAVMNENQFDFLKDLVADIEDIPEIVEPQKSTGDNGTSSKRTRRKKDPEMNLELDTSSDSSTNEEGGESPAHRRRDIMLPVVVDVDDEHDEQTVTKDTDSVASLPVPIATPMASPNTMSSVMQMTETMQGVGHYDDDDDYDS